MPSNFETLFRHNLWANLKLIDFCSKLSDDQLTIAVPGTFGSVCETLVHIVANEHGYLRAIGVALDEPLAHGAEFPGFEAIHQQACSTGDAFIAVAPQTPDGATVRTEFEGREYDIPAVIPLIQAINHGTEHRAHIATSLTQAGVAPPQIDAWMYMEAGMP